MWVCIWQLGDWYGENHDDVDFKIQQALIGADIEHNEEAEENLFIESLRDLGDGVIGKESGICILSSLRMTAYWNREVVMETNEDMS